MEDASTVDEGKKLGNKLSVGHEDSSTVTHSDPLLKTDGEGDDLLTNPEPVVPPADSGLKHASSSWTIFGGKKPDFTEGFKSNDHSLLPVELQRRLYSLIKELEYEIGKLQDKNTNNKHDAELNLKTTKKVGLGELQSKLVTGQLDVDGAKIIQDAVGVSPSICQGRFSRCAKLVRDMEEHFNPAPAKSCTIL